MSGHGQSGRISLLILGAGLVTLSAPAHAQKGETESALDEIVVTAQRREQNLQEVPIAISAISAAKIEQLGIKDARDLSGLSPNVTIVQGTTANSAGVISMRGISSPASEAFGLDQANALYVDGVYIAASGAIGLDVMDIERVEVLRGPQGTLYGRNSTGGAISFIGRAPSKEMRLKAEAGVGNFNAYNAKISFDPGEILGVATAFSYGHRERAGTVDNILEPQDSRDPGSRDIDSFRGAARVEFGDSGSIQYIYDWTRNRGSPIAFQLTNTANGTPRSLSVNGQSLVVTQPAPVAQYLAAASFSQAACKALAEPTRAYRDEVCNDISSYATDEARGHNLRLENDFGAVKVKLTSGRRTWDSRSNTDLDGIGAFTGPAFSNATLFNGMPVSLLQFIPTIPAAARPFIASSPVPTVTQNLFDTNNHRSHEQTSHELEFSGDTESLDWVVGGFHFDEEGTGDNPQNSGFILDTNTIFTGNFGALGPSFVAVNPARYRMVQTRATLKYVAEAKSKAFFAQSTYYPSGRDGQWRFTVGGRYTKDDKTITRTQNGAAPFATPQTGKAGFSKFTWNLMLGYDVSDAVTAYARAATGYRSGGFNAGDAVDAGTNNIPNFNEESVISYEVGLKTELLDRRLRLNLAGYHNIYEDLAVNIPLTNAPAGTFASRIGNAGKVNYTGIEADFQALLSDTFSIDGSLGYVDVKYKEFLSGQSTIAGAPPINIASIVTPGYTSPFTANIAANLRFPFGSGPNSQIVARLAYTHEDGKYSFNNAIGVPFNDALKGDNRDLLDLQIAFTGISLGAGEGEVRFWGKNLTNSKDFARGIDFGQLGFAGGYFADPRTYGVNVVVKL